MKNYKINIDKPKPTQEEILAGRNFDSVLAQYNAAPGKVIKKPFWKTTGFIGSVAAVAATVAIVAMVLNGEDAKDITAPQDPGVVQNNPDNALQPEDNNGVVAPQWTPTKRTIVAPLAGVNIPFKQYKVNSSRGGSIAYPTGTKIKFQPNCFVDKNGVPVNGNVEIKYREMHDAVDFFLAGIPMEYDSAGTTYQLESAGMLEVAAFVNGEVVYLDKNKPMQIQMASMASGSEYNLYYFDTIAGNWTYQGKEKVAPMPYDPEQRKRDSLEALQLYLASMRNQMHGAPGCGGTKDGPFADVVRPVKADPTKNRFVVDFSKEEFPEMANYQNVIFEVDESKEKFDQANYDITWETVALSRGDNVSKYKLTLKKGLKTVKLDVYPVLDGEEYSSAFANYEKVHTAYIADSTARANSKPDVTGFVSPNQYWAPQAPNQAQVQMSDAELAKNFKFDPEAFKRMKAAQASMQYECDVQRTFSASGFGIYNCDSPQMRPQGSVLNLTINGPDNTLFTGPVVYHVDRRMNTVMTYSSRTEFHVNTSSQNLMWAVMNGELYYAENESFNGLPAAGDATIALKKVPKKLNSAEEMRAFFRLKAPNAG